jgi:hypothetical protein
MIELRRFHYETPGEARGDDSVHVCRGSPILSGAVTNQRLIAFLHRKSDVGATGQSPLHQ